MKEEDQDSPGKQARSTTTTTSAKKKKKIINNINREEDNDAATTTTTTLTRAHAPTKFGKAHPLRDVSVLVGFFAIVLYWTMDYHTPTKHPSSTIQTIEHMADTLNQMTASLALLAEKQWEKIGRSASEPCSVFVSPSSIPGAGRGLFAGQPYRTGERIVLHPNYDKNHDSIEDETVRMRRRMIPVGDNLNLWTLSHVLLIKHHPSLANVKGTFILTTNNTQDNVDSEGDSLNLVATRPIVAGDELFVRFDSHPRSMLHPHSNNNNNNNNDDDDDDVSRIFNHIPIQSDYEMAQNIWDDADALCHQMRQKHRLTRIRCDAMYKMLAVSVGRVNPIVASLLPHKPSDRRNRPVYLAALQNQSETLIRAKGSCLVEDVTFRHSDGIPVAGRSVSTGQILTVIPLFIVANTRRVHLSTDPHPPHPTAAACVGQNASQFLVCPLAYQRFIMLQLGVRTVPSNAEGNLDLQWTNESKNHQHQLSIKEILRLPPGSLQLNVVATRDIRSGDQLSSHSSGIESLLPDAWRLESSRSIAP